MIESVEREGVQIAGSSPAHRINFNRDYHMNLMEEAQPALTVNLIKQRKREVECIIQDILAKFEHENDVTVSAVGISSIQTVASTSQVGTFEITVTI